MRDANQRTAPQPTQPGWSGRCTPRSGTSTTPVAEQVTHEAAVTRTVSGSRVEWLSDTQRRRIGEAEAGTSALSGLLD